MKLTSAQTGTYFTNPDKDAAGVLIYGADAMRIAHKRQQIVAALIGPAGEEEMRLTRIAAADLRREPALALDAVKAMGFFPGARVALIEDANENVGPTLIEALGAWNPGDAQIIVTAGALKPTSKMRKAFETHGQAYAAGIYDTPPTRDEIERDLKAAGIDQPPQEAMQMLLTLARDLEPGDFRQTLTKIGLYKRGDSDPLSADDISACAPASIEAAVDDVLLVVGDGQAAEIGPVMQRLSAQGVNAVTLCIGAMRHFRTLHRAAVDTTGRPQIWGPNRDKMVAQARKWGPVKLEQALTELTDTDLQLRSAGQHAPALALVERTFIRLAMLAQR
ncbi:MAG: DNA polymerase III subunit delta [Tateyamaria sp.]|uniref:DNA polymerase III subunit delta n=1 Tax=Tateyamaria sp. TaxID=1929288 RepID=UPI00329FC3BF